MTVRRCRNCGARVGVTATDVCAYCAAPAARAWHQRNWERLAHYARRMHRFRHDDDPSPLQQAAVTRGERKNTPPLQE